MSGTEKWKQKIIYVDLKPIKINEAFKNKKIKSQPLSEDEVDINDWDCTPTPWGAIFKK